MKQFSRSPKPLSMKMNLRFLSAEFFPFDVFLQKEDGSQLPVKHFYLYCFFS